MSNEVRQISGDSSKPLQPACKFSPSQKLNQESVVRTGSENLRPEGCTSFDLYRARFRQIIDPSLRQLRSIKWSPKERKDAEESLLELLLHWLEREEMI